MDKFNEYLDAVTDAINSAPKDSAQEWESKQYRRGLIDAANALGYEWDGARQDMRQLAMGHDRPMCCGVWLDKVSS